VEEKSEMKTLFASLLLAASLCGCMMPLKPGNAKIIRPDGSAVSVLQSENPKTDTVQDYKRTTDTNGVTTEEVHTKIGAAQKDVAREMAAKLGSMRGIMWLGVLVFLFGAASFVYPPLKLIVASTTTSAVVTGAGLLLIVLPTLIVGNELLILGGSLGGAALYFFAHRYGKLRGFVDANKDGIDDRNQ
jgi:hypothetical protein